MKTLGDGAVDGVGAAMRDGEVQRLPQRPRLDAHSASSRSRRRLVTPHVRGCTSTVYIQKALRAHEASRITSMPGTSSSAAA